MLPDTTQTADEVSSQDQLENERQPLIQPQNTYPRFLSSTLDFFQQLYHSVIPPRMPSDPTAAETVRSSTIFRGWYPLNTPNSTTAPSTKSAERIGKCLREEESPSALRITEQPAESGAFENCDARPQKRLKEAASTTRIAEQEATAASTSWSTEQINTTQLFDNTIKDRGIHDRYKEFTSGGSALGAHDGSHDHLNYCETPENHTSTAPGPMVTHITTHKVTSLQGAHDFTIRDNAHITNVGVSNVSNYGRTFDLDIMERFMEKYVSLNAVHDSPVQDPDRKCHPETRLSVLKKIHDWTDNPDGSESIFWVHGPAGVGKSAIAQTIAHSYSRQKVAATFFFYRSDPSRNDGNKLFTTIAWQLALLIPAINKTHIINALNERPDLPRKDIETQFQELIVKPLQALSSQTQLSSLIIIIDGVDECVDEKLQRRFLKVIGSTVNDPDFPLRFLICSRPEAHIEEAIDSFQCAPLCLDLAELDDTYHDIEKYLGAEFSRIASEQDLDPTWPGDERIRKCVYKSSGYFIYASTLIKIIDDEYNSAPTQLDIVLGLKPHGGKSLFAELDALYMEILKRQRDWAFLNDILSLVLICYLPSSYIPLIESNAIIMNIPQKELCRKLRGMRSLLKSGSHIVVYHQSFLDFLQDSSRSGQYHISQRAGGKRYLDLITASIVRHVPIIFEQPDCHQKHFFLSVMLGLDMLSVDEVQQALQPLMHIQAKLLSIESASWQQVLRCKECNILSIIWDLVLYLTCRNETSKHKAAHPTHEVIAVVPVEQGLTENPGMFGPPTPFIATEVEQVVLEKSELDVCLSSVIVHLRETKLEPLPNAMTIDLMCSLLNFDYVETAMRVRSISDGQLLVDVIDYLINNEDFQRRHNTTIARSAARLALEVHARVPVLPRSLFCLDDLSQHSILKKHFSRFWFTPMFMGRILDRNYVLRVSCMFKEGGLKLVHDGMNTYESIKEWRRSNPSFVMMLRVMLEVAKAIQYFDSMDLQVVLDTNLDIIYLDLEYHVKVFPSGFKHSSTPSVEVQHWNVSRLGTTFYELYFDVEYPYHPKDSMLQRPSEPEISEELWQVIQRCCARDPRSQPTIDEVVQEMESWKLD